MPDYILQNCIDWNINARDVARRRAQFAGNIKSYEDACIDARRHQRNIDALNAQLGE